MSWTMQATLQRSTTAGAAAVDLGRSNPTVEGMQRDPAKQDLTEEHPAKQDPMKGEAMSKQECGFHLSRPESTQESMHPALGGRAANPKVRSEVPATEAQPEEELRSTGDLRKPTRTRKSMPTPGQNAATVVSTNATEGLKTPVTLVGVQAKVCRIASIRTRINPRQPSTVYPVPIAFTCA
jgi:hypothetical protein